MYRKQLLVLTISVVCLFWYFSDSFNLYSTFCTPPDVLWESYGRDVAGTRYSPLSDINAHNVHELTLAWQYNFTDHEKGGITPSTPIVVDDGTGRHKSIIVFCSRNNTLIALDPTNGDVLWKNDNWFTNTAPFVHYCRGVGSWENKKKEVGALCRRLVYIVSADERIGAVDAATGQICTDFGNGGTVVPPSRPTRTVYGARGPPVIANNVVAVAPWVLDGMKQDIDKGPTSAFDAATGELKWIYSAIPPEPLTPEQRLGWLNGTNHIGSGNAWSIMTADEELGTMYMPIGAPSSDFFGGYRPGASPYTSSLVAVDSRTGKQKWGFQMVHHDTWDTDLAGAPSIIKVNGRKIVAVGTKKGHIWLLDAITGNPIFGYEELVVPKSDVPEEKPFPTQPFPLPDSLRTLPPAVTESLVFGVNEAEYQSCLNWFKFLGGHQKGEMYTPISKNGSFLYPTPAGGVNWGGCSANPERSTFTCVVKYDASPTKLVPRGEPAPSWCITFYPGVDVPYSWCNGAFRSTSGYPCLRPPWSQVVMISMIDGSVLWRTPVGYVPLPGYDRKWGSLLQTGGVMETAGGVLFVAGTQDGTLYGFEYTGKEIYEQKLPHIAYTTPITYRIEGTQYVAIVSLNISGTLLAYALPPPQFNYLAVIVAIVIVIFILCFIALGDSQILSQSKKTEFM